MPPETPGMMEGLRGSHLEVTKTEMSLAKLDFIWGGLFLYSVMIND